MSSNEWLGDATTHFMKSGTALRSPANHQEALAHLVPREANGVKVEYDISFEVPGQIHGYKFSDFLTKAIYIAPQSGKFAVTGVAEAADREPTAEGRRVLEQLRAGIEDKYILDDDEDFHCDEIVVLPGTNLLTKEDVVDMEKIDKLVAGGAYVKIHPITERTWVAYLTQRWGRKVIPAEAPLYPILRNAKKVHFTMSSETGIAATIFGKHLGIVDHPHKKNFSTFQHIYNGLDCSRNGTLQNRLAAVMSHASSGITTTYHDDPESRINDFFQYMTRFPHKVK